MVLFNAFEAIFIDDPTVTLQNTRDELGAQENGLLDAYRANKSVPLPSFLIFLFIQLYHRNSPLASPRHDVWPQEASTVASVGMQPMLSPTRAMALSARVTDHEDQLQFVKRHLYDMLVLVALGKYKVSLPQIQDFQLLLYEGENLTKETSFGSLMPCWQKPAQSKEQPADKTQLVDISVLQTYVSQRLVQNSALYPSVDLPTNRSSTKATWQQNTKAYINSLSGVTKSLFVRTAENMNPQNKIVRIYCNHQANIYLLMPLQHVAIFGCTNCTIILGTVSRMVTIEHCEKVRVVCATKFLRINHSADTRIYACINTRPVIGSGNKNIEMAPYNIHYPALEHHMQVAGINPKLNYWDMPICLSKDVCVGPLPASLFSSIAIPFNVQGITVCNPCPLPLEYSQELRRKTTIVNQLCEKIRQMSDNNGEGKRLIHSHFREWLVNSGNLRHVLDLLYHDDKESQ
jgi:TBCC domain-containing protein 1